MFRFLEKLRIWQPAVLVTVLFALALYCIWAAVTLAWLSVFPEQAAQIEMLEHIRLDGISCIDEVVSAFGWREFIEGVSNCPPEVIDGSGADLAENGFELGEDLFAWD